MEEQSINHICADVVVTYNRRELLAENISALLGQTFPYHDIIIIDNASTDGTFETVSGFADERIKYYNTGANLGGAGGFSFGIKKAIEAGYKYAWVMDDDAIPESGALQSLINNAEKINDTFSFIASFVKWTDGRFSIMNFPACEDDPVSSKYSDEDLRPVTTCSFVGCFINLAVAAKTALPISDFFIYGDDIEYTGRLRKLAPAYLDFCSVIIHKSPSNTGIDVARDTENRIGRYYYQSRNEIYIARKNKKVFQQLLITGKRAVKILLKAENARGKRLGVLFRGTKDGFSFDPILQYADKNQGQ